MAVSGVSIMSDGSVITNLLESVDAFFERLYDFMIQSELGR